ncbi:MAG: peptidylprolyl isomerase [Anaerolineae bacterium]|nr:peptidylprolyl isomerase [Anaerolineae bacterium]
MSKREQTTGVPKNRRTTQTSEKEFKSRHEREAEIQRYVIIGTIVTVVVVALILIAAVVVELIITPNQTVATVNGDTISVAQFEERVRFQRALLNQQINDYINLIEAQGLDPNQFASQEPLSTWLSQVQIPDQLGNSVINDMVDELLIRQKAEELGITVSEEDVDQQIQEFFGFDPETAGLPPTETPEPTITPTPFVSPTPSPAPTDTPTPEVTEEATEAVEATPTWTPFPTLPPTATLTADEQTDLFEETRDSYLALIRSTANISNDTIRSYFEARALRKAVRDELMSDMTTDTLHVNARHILVETEETAQDILAALEDNESFAALAQAASIDTGSGARGGELGWTAVTDYVEPFAEAVTDAPIGEIVGPVQSEFGYHIIQVHAKENREITEAQLESARDRRFSTYLDDLNAAEETSIDISPIWTDHVPEEPVFVRTA